MSFRFKANRLFTAGLVAGLSLLLFLGMADYGYDDPFITFRYADNLRSGLGFVYNPGERVLSTTTPLYALLLAVLGFLWSDLPRLSNLISAVSLVLGGIALYNLGQRWGNPLAGLFAAGLLPVFPLLISTFGAETCFYVTLILWAFVLYAREQDRGAMALAALATLTRPDGVLVGVVLGVALWIRRRRIPWQPFLLFGMLIAPWYLFSWAYFGSPFPVTLAAKQAQARMAISDSFTGGFLRLARGYARHPLYWLQAGLALLGLGYALVKARKWLPLIAWGGLYFGSYALLRVSRYFWYYAPLVPVFVALVGLGGEAVSHWLAKLWPRRWTLAMVSCLMMGLLFLQPLGNVRRTFGYRDPRARIYREVGEWLAQNTPPDALVGTLEVGIIGYYARRPMVDFAGLIQPQVAEQMRYETTYQDTALWAIQHYHPDYLVLNPEWFPSLMGDVVQPSCAPLHRFTRDEYPGSLVVYACNWSRGDKTIEP